MCLCVCMRERESVCLCVCVFVEGAVEVFDDMHLRLREVNGSLCVSLWV